MLKSTHRTVTVAEDSLPEGWTAHKAPTGHTYYYNAATKQSTYTRPERPVEQPQQIKYDAETLTPALSEQYGSTEDLSRPRNGDRGQGIFTGGRSYQDRSRQQNDRPRSKRAVLNCAPWFLIMTKMKRRFVYNSETNESFWKFPQDVMLAVIEMERVERERAERGEAAEARGDIAEPREGPAATAAPRPQVADMEDEDSDEYEEVEVTDDEDEGGTEDPASKRPRTEEAPPSGPVEFNEDDIAFQLAQMGEEYGLDPGEYENPDDEREYQDGEEGLPLTREDTEALFRDLLDDFKIHPYTTFDKLIEDGHIINDDRYTVLPNMSSRKDVFTAWSSDRIRELQAKKAHEAEERRHKDPRATYLNYLQDRASLKLYWPEFRRKFKKDEEMRDSDLHDKDREKLYREYTTRLKMSESDRKSDFTKLLRDVSKNGQINRETTLETLPNEVLRDVKLYALPVSLKEEILRNLTAQLPPSSGDQTTQSNELAKQQQERQRREEALAERQRRVEAEKRRTHGALRHGREMLRDEAEQLERAKRVGRDGLRGYMDET